MKIGGPCANHLRMTSIVIYLSLFELTTNVEILVVSSLDAYGEITLHSINSNPVGIDNDIGKKLTFYNSILFISK